MKRLEGVSRETEEALEAYEALIREWNPRINLVSPRDLPALRARHIEDCLQLPPLLPAEGPAADLGSGGGLPGIVIALLRAAPLHLVESDRRKAAFLLEATRRLNLPHVTVHPARIEAVQLPPLAAVAARALAPLPELLNYAHRLLAPGGVAVFPKGRNVDAELTEAARHWFMRVERFPSRAAPDSVLLRLSEIRPAGA
ncbi:16S rRNA (guanine(527)-N(7))-methyltransferase RsmG [Sabulicella rubraurantiaca]|uniref:16S rRNA (guanine(527)-N(7))-methyltransferase RsmG n=1 Tax=Sabulicella rubraurantiaca TaxID=2811429 RepID=UPI001A95D390|nr:16S rRNA (guanine(527)-N(7))-methyltransferase RsmG [Sabulicella rubraurantiaca]